MKTPIYDFLKEYAEGKTARLHMPGHKGAGPLGIEAFDITEIAGADSLYEAEGIIAESEKNAGAVFGADTFYSAGGSSLSIRAMVYLASLRSGGKKIIAARNVHKSFISAVALLGLEVSWIFGEGEYLSLKVTTRDVERAIERNPDAIAVYLTSPDYLGGSPDVRAIAEVCHKKGIPLLVDNAHGAYLKFVDGIEHPMESGADMCADSAHKTLPVLTGGGYLHINKNDRYGFLHRAREALSLFGSTSPSYLILSSLDCFNAIADGEYRDAVNSLVKKASIIRVKLRRHGYGVVDSELCDPLKITVSPLDLGYSGYGIASLLRERGVECEFCDPDYTVFMLTPSNSDMDIERLEGALLSIPRRVGLKRPARSPINPHVAMSVSAAVLSPFESVNIESAVGRILASVSVPCPPAVPILVPGEVVSEQAVKIYEYYGIKRINVVKT